MAVEGGGNVGNGTSSRGVRRRSSGWPVAGVEARTEKQYGGDAADHLREVSDLFEASMIAWVRGPRECEG
jgi:hypothetical protein